MKNQINNRLRILIKAESISQIKFCEIIGISEDTLKSTFKKDANPGTETLIKICDKFPQYSINWLLTGNGCMEMDAISSVRIAPSRNLIQEGNTERLTAHNKALEQELKHRDVLLDEKDKLIAEKERTIELLNENNKLLKEINASDSLTIKKGDSYTNVKGKVELANKDTSAIKK